MNDPGHGLLVDCLRWKAGEASEIEDLVSREERIVVRLEGRGESRLWAHPVDLDRLAVGHAKLTWCVEGERPELVGREAGRWTFRCAAHRLPEPRHLRQMSAGEISESMRAFIGSKGLWDGTGCFHRAGAYDQVRCEFPFVAEDIGRHNCLDRLAGWAVENGIDLSGMVLFVSARLTASLMAKALICGFRFCVSRSAVTTAALDLARTAGATLVGFARTEDARFTLFNDPDARVRL
ncbi:formate dehydrogenase subunit FdhD [Desulfovibrio sp. X2]|uniref:formate dehydrogenase accessory sulfurtransferase FdhD n=1 Tax=Desulfovibrio sp. X2 TaxID=941449 RepID=UPI000358AF3F|nr:formate dehydrogenase accessory sulfurtransferase FdhD [Desulfovibrio sp. X2]EPR37321.1 formate dehydrogenase subunit FdhD [Desulfovibrio sp. X2]